jgi:hypothetical protein
MKKLLFVLSMILIVFMTSCGVQQAEYDKLKTENDKLKSELEECKNGAEKIIALVEKAYAEKNYSLAKENITKLYDNHPESQKNADFKNLLVKIEKEELIEQKKKEAEDKERIRLENLNNTGIWYVGHYVDEFGEPTKQGYITNKDYIKGQFSNTATQDSKLNVRFLISNSSDISIQLYEYADNNPVKAYSTTNYRVLIQDADGKRLDIRATNYSERLSFDKTASRQVHNVLMKGGTIKFKIIEIDTPTTEYEFTIIKADWYENASLKLKES